MVIFIKEMKKLNYIFVGGKRLGYETLNFLIKKNFKPLCVVPNKDDNGLDNIFNKSLVKLAKRKKIKIVKLKSLPNFLKSCPKLIIESLDVIFCLGSTLILPKDISYKQRNLIYEENTVTVGNYFECIHYMEGGFIPQYSVKYFFNNHRQLPYAFIAGIFLILIIVMYFIFYEKRLDKNY